MPRHITVADGLPSNMITGIVKDDQGFVWISTDQGFCRWDGLSSVNYQKSETDTNSLPANGISRNAFIWDPYRQKLIIGHQAGISFFDPNTGIFSNLEIDPDRADHLPGIVNSIFCDQDGILWVGTDNGFCSIDKGNRVDKRLLYQKDLPPGVFLDHRNINRVHDITLDKSDDDILWLASLAGLLKYNKATDFLEWFYYPDPHYLREVNQFNMVVSLDNGEICLGTWNFDLLFFDTMNEMFSRRFGQNETGRYRTRERLVPYFPAENGKVWVSSLEGLGILDPESGDMRIRTALKNPGGLRILPEFFLQDEDHLWLGSENGIYLLAPESRSVRNYVFKPLNENYWYLTRALMELSLHDQIIIGYGRGEGLHFFNQEAQTFQRVAIPQGDILGNTVSGFLQIDREQLLFLSRNHIYTYHLTTRQIDLLDIGLRNLSTWNDIKMDTKGRIWLASNNFGLQRLYLDRQEIADVIDWQQIMGPGVEMPNFNELYIDHAERIWFRRKGGSYGFYEVGSDTVRYFNKPGEFHDITCFGGEQGDSLWVAVARKGIGFIDLRFPEKGVELIHSFDTLPVRIVSAMIMDRKNRLWCLSGKGLLRLNPATNKIRLFDENYGIIVHDPWSDKNNLLPGRLLQLEDGNIVIGYRHGLGFFHPDSMEMDISVPAPYLTSFQINEAAIDVDPRKGTTLSHRQNNLSFTYSAHDLYQKGITLQHQLVGRDHKWQNAIPGRANFYPNIAAGRYELQIKASHSSGEGKPAIESFPIKIRLPWWQTPWAYALFILLIIMLTVFVYRIQVKKQDSNREAKRLRGLDELKTKLYANITHEFRTPITVIMGMAAELAEGKTKLDKISFARKVETIERNSTMLLNLVNQMLDLAKIEAGKMVFQPVRNNIIAWLRYIVESHQSLAESKKVQLTFLSEIPELEMDYDPDQLSKVVTNLLTNAIKFTDREGKVLFHIDHERHPDTLWIKVKDNGIGIPDSEKQRIFDRFYQVENTRSPQHTGTGIGLSLSREIVEMLGGSISVSSIPEQGTEFNVRLPITKRAPLQTGEVFYFDKKQLQGLSIQMAEDMPEGITENGIDKAVVLIAEDNPDLVTYIKDIISKHYQVVWASDGTKALTMALEQIPDLVITDVMMPGKDGFELCNDLKTDKRTDHIPVIMLTARVTVEDRISGYEKGADAYLTKPFNKAELLVRIEQLLKIREKLQQKYGKLDVPPIRIGESSSPEEQFILSVSKIVEKNIRSSDFNAADLAQEVHLSKSQLYRKLKAISGRSTAVFIRMIRLRKAKELLMSSSQTISEIAYQVGFNDPAWFSRVFREEFSRTPSEFRKSGKE